VARHPRLDREELLAVAEGLAAEHDLHWLTIQRLAEATGYTRVGLYRYFATRNVLFMALGNWAIRRVLSEADAMEAAFSGEITGRDKAEIVISAYGHEMLARPHLDTAVKELDVNVPQGDPVKQETIETRNAILGRLIAAAEEGARDRSLPLAQWIGDPRRCALAWFVMCRGVVEVAHRWQMTSVPVLDGLDYTHWVDSLFNGALVQQALVALTTTGSEEPVRPAG